MIRHSLSSTSRVNGSSRDFTSHVRLVRKYLSGSSRFVIVDGHRWPPIAAITYSHSASVKTLSRVYNSASGESSRTAPETWTCGGSTRATGPAAGEARSTRGRSGFSTRAISIDGA